MKKTLIISLVLALLLVLAVSCENSGTGTLVVDYAGILANPPESYKNYFTPARINTVEEAFIVIKPYGEGFEGDETSIEVALSDFKKGTFSLEIPEGTYEMKIQITGSQPVSYEVNIGLVPVAKTKTPANLGISIPIVINPGKESYCTIANVVKD